MNRSKIVDRVRKLLALATSPNKNEAKAAKRMASALKKRHKVTAKEIDEKDPYRRIEVEPVGADPYWREELAKAFAGRDRCVVLRKDRRIFFEGANAAHAARTYRNVANQIVAECQRTWAAFGGGVKGALYLVWSTTFKAEAVRAIAFRIAGVGPMASPSSTVPENQGGVQQETGQLAKAKSEAVALVDALSVAVGRSASSKRPSPRSIPQRSDHYRKLDLEVAW